MDHTSTDTLTPGSGHPAADSGLVRLCGGAGPRLVEIPPRCTVVVGRDPGGDGVVVAQQSVSRVHIRVERDRERVMVADLGSKNGTFVNGERIAERRVEDGDEIRIGDVVYKFVAHDAAAVARACDTQTPLPYGFVGGHGLQQVLAAIPSAAASGLNVLVTGESGTGKELVARALHEQCGRTGKLRAVNCAAIPTHLFESEIFGYKRGAFTGADRDHQGILRAAHGGTLFLDEVGDMPLDAQAKLLRVLETREVVPVGSIHGEPVDVRVVSATHQDLRHLVGSGRFRGDLHARLNGFALHLPPLRRRKEDLEQLTRHFLGRNGVSGPAGSDDFMLALVHYDWPYNVRELGSAIQRAVAVAGQRPVDVMHLPDVIVERYRRFGEKRAAPPLALPAPASVRPSPSKTRPTHAELVACLLQHRGNVAAMARTMGKDRAQVHRWLRDASVDVDSYRK